MKVVDTTLLIDHARGATVAKAVLEAHDGETLVVPAVAFGELAVGEVIARSATEAEALAPFRAFDVRAFTPEHAYHAAVIEATLRRQGEYRDGLVTDIQVGGVARALGAAVLTRNVADFERFDAVDVESY